MAAVIDAANIHGTFTAKVDGSAFEPNQSVSVQLNLGLPAVILIKAVQQTGANSRYFMIQLNGVTKPRTYSLAGDSASGGAVFGDLSGLIGSTAIWASGETGGSGSITFTTVNASHITGTFTFREVPSTGAPGVDTKTVTNGTFDITASQM